VKADDPWVRPDALYLGHPEAPNELIIRKPAGRPDGADDADRRTRYGCRAGQGGILPRWGKACAQAAARARILWIAVAGGTGTAYHGRENVDSNAKVPGTTRTGHRSSPDSRLPRFSNSNRRSAIS
jgi:hypothetical protein